MAESSNAKRKPARAAPAADAPAHLTLAEALARLGRREEAIALYEIAARADPAAVDVALRLARLLLEAGRPAEAFQRADTVLALDPENAHAWNAVAEAMEALGECDLATRMSERAVALAPEEGEAHARLARLYEALDRPHDAAAHWRRALALGPTTPVKAAAHVALSGLHGRAGQFDVARCHAETALRLAPGHRGAHQNLAAICDHEGRAGEAEAHRERAYRGAPLTILRAARPVRRVLTLASAGRANSPDRHLLPAARYDRLVWFLAYADSPPSEPYDVVFNAVSDPDAAAAAALARELSAFSAVNQRPTLNPPEAIARTARDAAERLFAGVAGLVAPHTRRVATAAETADLAGDGQWLLRPLGAHGGERVERLDLAEVAGRLDGRPRYLTAFVDSRSPDGLYRKYRAFFIDRAPYPYHMAASGDWLVHYQSSQTPCRADLIAEELRFLEHPEAAVGALAWRAVAAIGQRMDLDFAGVDFAVLPDGRALLFEANATMLVHPETPDGPLRHKNPFVTQILEAFWARLESV